MKYCKLCGELLPENTKFCPSCGATIQDPATDGTPKANETQKADSDINNPTQTPTQPPYTPPTQPYQTQYSPYGQGQQGQYGQNPAQPGNDGAQPGGYFQPNQYGYGGQPNPDPVSGKINAGMLIWAIMNLACCNTLFGIIAIVMLITAKGSYTGTEEKKKVKTAMILNLIGTILGIVFIVGSLIYVILTASATEYLY